MKTSVFVLWILTAATLSASEPGPAVDQETLDAHIKCFLAGMTVVVPFAAWAWWRSIAKQATDQVIE